MVPAGGRPVEREAGTCGVTAGAEGLVEWVVACAVPVVEEVAAVERWVDFGGGRRPGAGVEASSR